MGSRGRYGNVKKPVHDNIRFDSQRELERYLVLKLMQKAGEISELKLQPKYPIVIGGIEIRIKSRRYHVNGRILTYVADFRYRDTTTGELVIEDVKMQSGHLTEGYKIKRGLMEAMGYRIVEV